jgi:hypothetical protein
MGPAFVDRFGADLDVVDAPLRLCLALLFIGFHV